MPVALTVDPVFTVILFAVKFPLIALILPPLVALNSWLLVMLAPVIVDASAVMLPALIVPAAVSLELVLTLIALVVCTPALPVRELAPVTVMLASPRFTVVSFLCVIISSLPSPL